MEDFRLEHEKALAEGHSVSLLNTNEAGTIFVTNFRLLFVSKARKCVVELGTIPLTAIEKLNDAPSVDLKKRLFPNFSMLEVTGHDTRVIVFTFDSKNKDLKVIIGFLKKCIRPVRLEHIYAFSSKQPDDNVSSSSVRLHKEYHRLFHKWFAQSPSTCFEAQDNLQNKWWRVSDVNSGYKLCKSYPAWLIVPRCISDQDLRVAATYRIEDRLPAISWFDSGSGAVLARSSQPKGNCLTVKERLVCALRTERINRTYPERKLYIVDVRGIVPAYANLTKGGGSELSYIYTDTEVCYSGIDNIHGMRTSFCEFREYINAFGSFSSDGLPLHERDPISGVGLGRTPKSMVDISKLQTWLSHIQSILSGASYITAKMIGESASVLVHCSDGWDRTSQLIGLSCLLLDPFYRTFSGFQALVEKDWLAFGHKFAARMGLPTIMDGEVSPKYKLPWHADGLSPSEESSPIFLQWLECIAHLLCVYPCAFEFSSKFLVDLMDAILSCRFGNFLCNSEWEREQAAVKSCLCIWTYLADLRASDPLHEHRNPLYDPEKHNGPIVPPVPALVPTIWPQFYLRWSCPVESHGGVGGLQKVVKAKMAGEPIRKSESLPADENPLNVIGRRVHVVGCNVKKL